MSTFFKHCLNFQCLSHFLWVLEAWSKFTQVKTKFSRNFQKTSTVKLLTFSWRFQTEERALWVNKSEINCQNAFHGVLFEIEDNHESTKDEKTWF